MKKHLVELSEISQDLEYCLETGVFRWKKHMGGRAPKAGGFAGTPHIAGYTQIGYKQNIYLAHRLAWLFVHGSWPEKDLDHINGNKTDNRICNLRECTHAENMLNRRKQKNNRVGHKNICLPRGRNQYVVRIAKHGKTHCAGYYYSLEDAIKARDAALKKVCGEFAKV
jgi:hypothetical protein